MLVLRLLLVLLILFFLNFECSFDNNNAMTQIYEPSLVKYCNIQKIDQSRGPDYPLFDRYFHGYQLKMNNS